MGNKDLDPRLPASVRGGAHVLGQQKQEEAPPPPPWDNGKVYKLRPQNSDRVYYFADKQDDAEAGWGLSQIGIKLMKAISVKTSSFLPDQDSFHREIQFVGIGIIIEIVSKPEWWKDWNAKFPK